MAKTILLIGAFDTKDVDYAFVRARILHRGHRVLTVNTGVLGTTDLFPGDIESADVAEAGGANLQSLRTAQDRGKAMQAMSAGAPKVLRKLFDEGRFDCVIGLGGSGGSSVISAAMQALPVGIPKICVSTVASGDPSAYVGLKDVTLIPSVVDVAGVNRVSSIVYARAAGAICGMVEEEVDAEAETGSRPVIAASMFGNTTQCVDACVQALGDSGYEVLVFHATGAGGRTMESLVDEGLVDGVLDITTTEWADEICEGVFTAGSDRLSAPGRRGLPHLIVPGCIDMANFNGPQAVPERYREADRLFYDWNPTVTLMRTNVEENRRMGEIFARKANESTGPVAFLLPLRGVSVLDGEGERCCDREADAAMFESLKQRLRTGVPVYEMDANINDPAFSARAVELMLELISARKQEG